MVAGVPEARRGRRTFDRERTEYAVRKDGVLLKKLCAHRPPDAYSKGGWHDWGWHIASRRGKKDVMAEIERVDYLLKSRGFVRVRS